MPFGTLDLSIITDHLMGMLRDCITDTAIWDSTAGGGGAGRVNITVTGNAPDVVRDEEGCQLSLYLFHVAPDPYQRNSPVVGDRTKVPTIPYQPLSLDLYYLLSANSFGRYVDEQQAMSIALKCFHEQPIVKDVTLDSDDRPKGEFVLSMEALTFDDLGRLWQSWIVANRLSVVYKVSVVFIEPVEDVRPIAKAVERTSIVLPPVDLPLTGAPQLLSTSRNVRFIGPDDNPADPLARDFHDYALAPAVVAPTESFVLHGSGLAGTIELALVPSDGAEVAVTAWIGDPASNTELKLTLNVPASPGVDPGAHQLRATVDGVSTNTTPFSLAALVTPSGDPPVVNLDGSPVQLQGVGFVKGSTELFLDTIPLTESDSVEAGTFVVDPAGDKVEFLPPIGLDTGRYSVRIRVNGIESTPSVWVEAP